MNARIKVIENSTGKLMPSQLIEIAYAGLLLAALPDQCSEKEAKYTYKVYTLHHGGEEQLSLLPQFFTTIYHPIDLTKPFYRKHDLGSTKIFLAENGLPAGTAIIKSYDAFTKKYKVDVTLQGSDITDKDVDVTEDKLITPLDIINGL
ncbi:hypothetical protein SAMN05428988_3209 [Chitinophaga sp. YR573]|uniref:hypothetical protein n=1 Tax=Chitinophaga sp. YR573 TaxID=1881040 RepID=UPI0008CB4BC6|nr:hypothetical protein [Chitinophaga sp. YR573]SEW21426.1 hypothetical protein SAMN05428988_3209 [Chitinophaga sp. YR573]